MKTIGAIIKVLTALATVAGAIYIIATYGDKIVAWAKEMMTKCPCAPSEEPVAEEAAPVEEAPAAEEAAPVEEAPVAEEAPAAEEVSAVEEVEAPVADEADFEG